MSPEKLNEILSSESAKIEGFVFMVGFLGNNCQGVGKAKHMKCEAVLSPGKEVVERRYKHNMHSNLPIHD